jgi:hypothetical protein
MKTGTRVGTGENLRKKQCAYSFVSVNGPGNIFRETPMENSPNRQKNSPTPYSFSLRIFGMEV